MDFAASTSFEVRYLLPCLVAAGLRLPVDSFIAGANPVHPARCPAVANRDMSPPVSAMNTCEVTTPTPALSELLDALTAGRVELTLSNYYRGKSQLTRIGWPGAQWLAEVSVLTATLSLWGSRSRLVGAPYGR